MNASSRLIFVLCTVTIINGCGIGQKKVLFTTRSNVGLDVDAKQFTAQLNIDRQEAVIGPTFEGGQHVPIAAGFRNNNKLLGGFGVSSFFAGGDAALALTTPSKPDRVEGESLIALSEPPEYKKGIFGKFFNLFKDADRIEQDKYLPGPGQVTPFIFDTDTSLGIKLAWTGAAAEFPDKVKIGFNREEFALAPVVSTKKIICHTPADEDVEKQQCTLENGTKLADAKQRADASKTHADEVTQYAELSNKYEELLVNTFKADEQLAAQAHDKAIVDQANEDLQNKAKQAETKKEKAKSELETWKAKNIENNKKAAIAEAVSVNELKNAYSVGVPSFFAAIDSHSKFKSIADDTDIGFRQVFAAGKSATNLANNPYIRSIIKAGFGLSDASLCLTEWLKALPSAADSRTNNDRAIALTKWLEKNDYSVTTTSGLINNPHAWQDFASKNISPGICQNNE